MSHVPLVDLKAQYATIQAEIDDAVARVIASTRFIGGPELTQFEAAFAAFQGAGRAVGVASGTAALYLALKALDIGPGDEVITTPHTFIATIEAIELLGITTVLADIDPDTYNIDPARVEAAITPATRAIIPVHLYGQMAPMDQIMDIAHRHNLLVIEDAAQAHAAEYQGKRAGQWGHVACFSFYPGKNLGAYGEAGAILTNNDALADRIARLRDHGGSVKYQHDEIGTNERMDALQAAVLAAKLPHLEDWTTARRRHAAYYNEKLAGMPGIVTPFEAPGARHVYHVYCVRVSGDREAIKTALNERDIGAGIHYPVPAHLQPALAYRGWRRGDFPNAEAAADSVLSLPMYPELTTEQIDRVVTTLRAVLAEQVAP